MNPSNSDTAASLRWAVYGILIAFAAGNMAGRILAVNSVDVVKLEKYRIDQRLKETEDSLVAQGYQGDELKQQLDKRRAELEQKLPLQRPFLSSNDRSRWATVRALVELGTYEIDKIIAEPRWDTIDMVAHTGDDGQRHIYSSKPPLLATLIAGEYWIVHKITGGRMTLGTHPHALGRFFLLTINLPLFLILFVMLAWIVERFGRTTFGRIFVMAAATSGTLLSSFAVTLNNHLFAATSITVALWAALRIIYLQDIRCRNFLLAGLAGAFAVSCELPALAFLAIVLMLLLGQAPVRTLIWTVPAVLLVAAAFFGTNYIAHNTWSPPYAHRHSQIVEAARQEGIDTIPSEAVNNEEDNWYIFTFESNGKVRQSYWSNPNGIDRGEQDKGTYALHVLVGHHGIFSLTPVWFLSLFGAAAWLIGRGGRLPAIPPQDPTQPVPDQELMEGVDQESGQPVSVPRDLRVRQGIALATLGLTAVCLVFFIHFRPAQDRNYGGMTNGFRWLFWLIPLWLVTMLPAADWLGHRRWTRGIAFLLLALSALSAAYATWNPWSQPWIARWMESMGWITFG